MNALLSVAAMGLVMPATANAEPHRYWPRFPEARTVLTVRDVPSMAHGFLLQSVSGLAARAALNGTNRTLVWYPIGHAGYDEWRQDLRAAVKPDWAELPDIWALVDRFRREGIVKGYVIFREEVSERALHSAGAYDPSANVATVLAGQLGGVMVTEGLEDQAKAHGLTMLADARGISEERCFEEWSGKCSRTILAMIDPKTHVIRAEAIAMNAFVLATHGPLYERALAAIEPDSPILGWGMGDEFHLTEPVSRWGAWNSATNWCLNLPLLATEKVGPSTVGKSARRSGPRTLWDLSWERGVHYASFLMTDGDNVQWLMGDFIFSAEHSWWNSPARGKFPMGWGACTADLAQLCPYALRYLLRTASENDDLVLLGGGYYYPDLFGASRQGVDVMRLHARRMRAYMELTGTRLMHMNASKWDSPAALKAYRTIAEEIPLLDGIFMIQYAPYSAGKGRILWVRGRGGNEVPVASARFAIWGHSPFPDDGPPAEVAGRLNAMPPIGDEAVEDNFSWVTVHCWSWFRRAAADAPEGAEEVEQKPSKEPDVRRGLEPVEWCIDRLDRRVKVVTPSEMALLMRLRLRPKATLRQALADLERRAGSSKSAARAIAAKKLIAAARASLRQHRPQQAFESGKRAATLLRG